MDKMTKTKTKHTQKNNDPNHFRHKMDAKWTPDLNVQTETPDCEQEKILEIFSQEKILCCQNSQMNLSDTCPGTVSSSRVWEEPLNTKITLTLFSPGKGPGTSRAHVETTVLGCWTHADQIALQQDHRGPEQR